MFSRRGGAPGRPIAVPGPLFGLVPRRGLALRPNSGPLGLDSVPLSRTDQPDDE